MSHARSIHGRFPPLPRLLLAVALVAALATACSGPQPPTATPAATPTASTVSPSPTARAAATRQATPATPRGGTATRPGTATRTSAVTRTGTAIPPGAASLARAGLEGQDITALAVSVGQGDTLYAGGQGVWKSADGGGTWSAVLDAGRAPRVSALAVAPSNAQIVYAGVGEGCAKGTTGPGFVSADGGATWRETGRDFVALAVDPRNARLVYALSCRGVERSADAGGSWELLAGARVDNYDPILIAIAPADPQTLYVAYASEGGAIRVRRSGDGGTTWQAADLPGEPFGPLSLAVDAADARAIYLSTTLGVYKSSNSGRSWELLTTGLEGTANAAGAPPGARTTSAIAADPARAGVLWLGTGAGRAPGDALYGTRDGGRTWRKVVPTLNGLSVRALALAVQGSDRLLYVATDDGVWSLPVP